MRKEKEVVGIYISGHPLDDFNRDIRSFCNAGVSNIKELEKFANKELRIAGIITDAQHRTTKHGKPFGTFDIEDYTDTERIFIFGEDYLKFKHLLNIGTFVFIAGRVQAKKWGDGLEFKVTTMELLTELREKRATTLLVSVESSDISEPLIEDLYQLVQEHSGSCQLKFVIKDHKSSSQIKMPSRSFKVNVDNDFINKIEELQVFECAIE